MPTVSRVGVANTLIKCRLIPTHGKVGFYRARADLSYYVVVIVRVVVKMSSS